MYVCIYVCMYVHMYVCYLSTLKIKVSPFTFNCGFPTIFTTVVAGKKCENFNKNLNQRTLVFIRYTDERYEKALNRIEIYYCIIRSMSRRGKVFWDQWCFVKGNSLCVIVCCIDQMHVKTFYVYFTIAATLERCDYLPFQHCYALPMSE